MFSYCMYLFKTFYPCVLITEIIQDGIAAALTLTLLNYLLLGFSVPVDGFYMRSWEMWLAITVVFVGAGNIGITILDYRLYGKDLVCI